MNTKFKFSKIMTAAAAVLLVSVSGAARADAVGQAILDISNFSLRVGNGAASVSSQLLVGPGAPITVQTAGSTGDTKATLNGVTTSDVANDLTAFPIRSCVGACPAAILTPIVGAPGSTFAQSYSSIIGNSLTGTARAISDNTVSLAPSGNGSAQGNTELGADFLVDVLVASTIEINFNADAFLRAYLSASPGNARGSYNWGINIVSEATGGTVFSWSPDGVVGAISGGTEYLDAFDLTDVRTRNQGGDFSFDADQVAGKNQFHAETNQLQIGKYTLSVTHETFGDATLLLPEPAMLSLVSMALFGAAFASRRKAK